jgi:integrase
LQYARCKWLFPNRTSLDSTGDFAHVKAAYNRCTTGSVSVRIASMKLTLHRSGQLCCKIAGKFYYLGRDPEEAERRYHEIKAASLRGEEPKADPAGMTVAHVLNRFLTRKLKEVKAGSITAFTYHDYHVAAARVLAVIGRKRSAASLRPVDFRRAMDAYAGKAATQAKLVAGVRAMLNDAMDDEVIPPLRFGKAFTVRKARSARAPNLNQRDYTAAELRAIMAKASPTMRAMVLLGVNAGFGNTDCSELRLDSLDLENERLRFPRPKTGVERDCWLWPETIAAIRESLAERATPDSDDARELVFLTVFGRPWVRPAIGGSSDMLNRMFHALCTRAGVRPRGFYGLRRTFRTVADETLDQHAIHRVMGHQLPGMSGTYVQRIGFERIKAVCEHVRAWLFTPTPALPRCHGGADQSVV